MLLMRPKQFQIFEVKTVDEKLPKVIVVQRVGKPDGCKYVWIAFRSPLNQVLLIPSFLHHVSFAWINNSNMKPAMVAKQSK